MTDSLLLRAKVKECGFTLSGVAKRLNLTRQGFWKKVYNRSEFKQSEIETLSRLLELDPETERHIFFKNYVG